MNSLLLGTDAAGSQTISIFGVALSRRFVRWFARLWISIVIVGSLLPGTAKLPLHTSEANFMHAGHKAGLTHRLIHLVAFGSSFWLLSLLAIGRREQVQAAVEVLVIGCIIEFTQYIVYSHRQIFEWWDVRDDAIGIVIAFVIAQIAHRASAAFIARPESRPGG